MRRFVVTIAVAVCWTAGAAAVGAQGRACSLDDVAAAVSRRSARSHRAADTTARPDCLPVTVIAVFDPETRTRGGRPAYASGVRSIAVFNVDDPSPHPSEDNPAEILTRVHEDIVVGDLHATRGEYLRAISFFNEASQDLSVLARRYPRAAVLREHRRELTQAIARMRTACAAEAKVQRRRGGVAPRCA